MSKTTSGRRTTKDAKKSKVRDTQEAFEKVSREYHHIHTLLHGPEGEFSQNVRIWHRARVQTALERLIQNSIDLMRSNMSALNSAKGNYTNGKR